MTAPMFNKKRYDARYRKRHKKKRNAYSKKYYHRHKKRLRRELRAWLKKNPGYKKAYYKKYRRRNLVSLRLKARRYRLKKGKSLWKKSPEKMRAEQLLSRYGLSMENYKFLLKKQKACCAVCKSPFKKTPFVDHDHKTGAVRGLLCLACNFGLGYFRDSPTICKKAAKYLEDR